MKSLFLVCLAAATLAAQDASSGSGGNSTEHITAASEFFDHDFVNLFAFANGVWDSHVPETTSTPGVYTYGGGLGWEAGGGITATHTFKDGGFTVNYRGSYRDYQSYSGSNGQTQTLSFAYSKALNRRWTFSTNISGAILGFGSSFYSSSSVESTTPGNPYTLESRFANVGLNLTYAQTRRLSYVFTGSFLYSGYAPVKTTTPNPYDNVPSTRGVSGGISVLYRLTARTTVGGSYTHSYYDYSGNSGTANVDSAALTLSHKFVEHWQLDLSGGINRSDAKGIALTPVAIPFDGQIFTAYCYCKYDRTINSPAFQGTLSRLFRHYSVSISGGQSILAGNGLYLTSRSQFVNGSFSYSTRRTNISVGGNFARLSSVSTADLSQVFSYYGASGSYGVNLVRYLSANFRYDFIHYQTYLNTGDVSESRVSFGLSLSTKSVPLTLF